MKCQFDKTEFTKSRHLGGFLLLGVCIVECLVLLGVWAEWVFKWILAEMSAQLKTRRKKENAHDGVSVLIN
ncbi:hypothetical protein B0181_10280 [Moraxella caviae]|uniref:Uncharacterized protein n=1 Tax=Moraxella caviae TaxID=34060 RepID=A0A1S9ZX14_9GAMM|nr:hypothetical protein B0181_10280 [Moraxella caviae]